MIMRDVLNENFIKFKDNIAIISGDENYTYAEIDRQSDGIANYLSSQGVREGEKVILAFKEKLECIISMISLIKLNATYIPVDISKGTQYYNEIQKQVSSSITCTDDENISGIKVNKIIGSQSGLLKIKSKKCRNDKDFIAYIMFTSGTTGIPKGVKISQKSILNLVLNQDIVNFDDKTCFLQTGALTFDAATFEIWGTLLHGGTLVLADTNKITDHHYLKQMINKNKVNSLWLTSPLFKGISNFPETFENIKQLIVGGDEVDVESVNRIIQRNKNISIFNGYGPTECTTFSTMYRVTKPVNDKKVPIGKPLNNVSVYIVDNNMKVINEANKIGELFIGGDGVSEGYINNPEENIKRFIKFEDNLVYRTGDLVKKDLNGDLIFCGRKDRQFKIHGFRIELSDVENRLNQLDFINDSAVLSLENNGVKSLYAYVTTSNHYTGSKTQLIKEIRKKLPPFINLTSVIILDEIPLNKNGKKDYKQLKQMIQSKVKDFKDTNNNKLKDIVKKYIPNFSENKDVSFFNLGVDSLTAMYIANDIEKNYDINVTAIDILMNPTVNELKKLIKNKRRNKKNNVDSNNIERITDYQKSYFIDYINNPNSTKYNIPIIFQIDTNLDNNIIINSLKKVVENITQLNQTFQIKNSNVFVKNNTDFSVEILNEKLNVESLVIPFNLEKGPLYRFKIICDGDNKWIFMDFHHIIVDGKVLENVLQVFFNQLENKEQQLISNNNLITNINFDTDEILNFWQNKFKNLSLGRLPYDFDNGESLTNNIYKYQLSEKITDNFLNKCKDMRMTPFEGLSTIFGITLSIISGESTSMFMTPYRDDFYNDNLNMRTKTLWIRSDFLSDEFFYTYVEKLVREIRNSEQNAYISFEKLHEIIDEKQLNSMPLIAYHSSKFIKSDMLQHKKLLVKPISPKDGMATINLQIYRNENILNLDCEYLSGLFEQETIKSIIQIFISVLNAFCNGNWNQTNEDFVCHEILKGGLY